MLNEFIRDSDTFHGRSIFMVGHKFEYGTSHSSLNHSIFYGNDVAELPAYLVQQSFIQWFEES